MSANYSPIYTFYGDPQVNAAGSNNNSVARRGDVAGLSYITSIAAGSQSLLSVTNGALSVESLLITDVTVDTTHATLAAYVAAGIPATMKKGDVLILSNANPSLSYICKVASPSAAGDFAQLNEGTTYSAGDGIDLTGSTFSVDIASSNPGLQFASGELDVKVDPGGALQSGTGGLEVKLDSTTLSKSANGLKVSSIGNAEISGSAAIAQSKLSLSITNSEINAGAAIAQSKLSLDISNAQINNSAAIAQSKLDLSITNSEINNSAAIAQSKLALSITDSEIANNAAIANSKIAGLRYEANGQSLTANQAQNFNHGLGKKVVHVSVMTTSDSKLIDAEIVFTDANNLTVKSNTNLNVDVAISI